MSGSAGLAAAKRRRALGSGDSAPPAPGSGRVCRRNARTGVVSCGPAGAPTRTAGRGGSGGGQHPFVAHLQHQESRIRQLEEHLSSGEAGGIGVSDEDIASQVQEVASAAFEEVAGRVSSLESALSKVATPEATDIAYFRNKTEDIETGLADLKRLLLKVQSFAMETNCSLMKLQARIEKIESHGSEYVAKGRSFEAWETSMEERIESAVQRKANELVAACPAHPSIDGENNVQVAEQENGQVDDGDDGDDDDDDDDDEEEASSST